MCIISNGILVNAEWSIDYLIAISAEEAFRILSKKPGLFIFTDADDPLKSGVTIEDVLEKGKEQNIFYLTDRANEVVPEIEELSALNFLIQEKYVTSIKAEMLRIGRAVRGEELDYNGFLEMCDDQRRIDLIYVTTDSDVTIIDNFGQIATLEDKLVSYQMDNLDADLLLKELSKIRS